MIDRLPQFKTSFSVLGQSHSEQELEHPNRQQAYNDADVNAIGEQFSQEIKSVRTMISAINANGKKIQNIKKNYAKAIKSAQEKQNSDEMNAILQENAMYQKKIKDKLAIIAEQVQKSQKQQPDEPQTRMKKNFYLNLSKEVSETIQKQYKYQDQYKTMVKDKVTRQVKLIDGDLNEQQIQKYVNDPELAQQMLQKKLYGTASVQIKNAVSDIQDKFRDIQKLQASVNQCVQLFNELSNLVFAQGQKIDNIQSNVAECKDYIEKAQKKLVKAKQHHQCCKTCTCFVILGAVIVLIIIIIAVVATR